jgi:phage antirepressor YoqD-like protein
MKDNEPYQKYINEKYFQIEEYTVTTPYGVKLCKKTAVTGLGQIKLIQKLKSEFGLKEVK